MALVSIVIILALIEYMAFGGFVGWARGKYGIKAPAMTGDENFERYNRVHMNTLENLIVFIPSIFAFATFVNEETAAGIGLVFIIGRFLYFRGYIKEPKKRELGSMVSGVATIVLLFGGLIGAVIALF